MTPVSKPTFAHRMGQIALPPLLLLLIVIVAWHFAVTLLDLKPYQLPAPSRVATAAWNRRTELAEATAMTALAAGGGFLLSLALGTLIGIAFSQSRAIARSVYPYAIFLQTVPIVAIAPIIINWFGTGLPSVIVVSFIISLFPIITNMYAGLTAIDPNLLELFQLHNATRWQTLVKLRLPSAVPNLVTGAKVSAGLSVIGAIVGEFFAGATNLYGLGYLIPQALGQLKMDYGFAAVICSALLGLAVFGAVSLVGATLLSRWRSESN
jgi:NitT/TauT family transport system permease protein